MTGTAESEMVVEIDVIVYHLLTKIYYWGLTTTTEIMRDSRRVESRHLEVFVTALGSENYYVVAQDCWK